MDKSPWKQLTAEVLEDDGYWNSSTTYHNMFDDEDTRGGPRKTKSKGSGMFDDDDDDTEVVGWGGEPVSLSQLSAESARYRIPVKPKNDPQSELREAQRAEEMAKKKKEDEELALSLADAIMGPGDGDEPKMDAKKGPSFSSQGSNADVAKLKAELNFQTRRANAAESSRWTSLPVEDTIKRILSGDVYTLETYKSLDEKLSLLDAAIQSRDGNALTAVVVYFQSSVKNSIFLTQMKSRPKAIHHYLQFLRQTSRIPELIEALGMFGNHEEAAILKYRQAAKMKQPEQKIKSLKACLQAHYLFDPLLSKDAALIQQQIQLLEVQQPINQSDSEIAAKAKDTVRQIKLQQQQQQDPQQQQQQQPSSDLKLSPEIETFARFPRPSTLVGLPLLTSLSYCCTYHFGTSASFFGSPEFFRKTFGFSDKQYSWVALRAHARLKRWEEIEKLLKPKSWFGKKKIAIDFKKVASILAQQGADQRVVASYLWDVEDVEERLATAMKIQCHVGVVDAFAANKDRTGLLDYRRKLKGDETLHADLVLNNPKIKWKN